MSQGGQPILDYSVFWDNGSSGATYVLLDTVTTRTYTTTASLTEGGVYKFKLTARNSVGTSLESEIVTI